MRIGVYSVALNESQFVERWATSAADADYLFVADTGSSDETVALLEQHGVHTAPIRVRPWRFDDARNAALSLLPDDLDIVMSLDMDEILTPGWRAKLEADWVEGCNRLRYL